MGIFQSKYSFSFMLVVFFCLTITANGQEKKEVTVNWIYSDASRELTAVEKYVWLSDNTAILYDIRKPEEQRVFVKYNPATGL